MHKESKALCHPRETQSREGFRCSPNWSRCVTAAVRADQACDDSPGVEAASGRLAGSQWSQTDGGSQRVASRWMAGTPMPRPDHH